MVIERIDRSHWRSDSKVKVLEPGYEEITSDSFGTKTLLAVNSPDSVTQTLILGDIIVPHTYEREEINEAVNNGDIYWFRGLAALNLLIGKKVRFAWTPTEEPSR